ncbi:hypothetical protein PVAND_005567 [Polypedilum vanderplanki]|uniref:Uncharacterized protein n=1 Tax=Polypedilum vanderplanki TaxID=319348 RepID=A0A9J6C102_POLVA|nr:hypothetical protein PVAND_005567 [Polypedilum vanderplanki]
MVQIIRTDGEGKQPPTCSQTDCVASIGSMLKCSRIDCNKYYHLSCINVTEDEATEWVIWYCSDWCKAYSDPVKLRAKYLNQKELLTKTTKALNEFREAYRSQSAKVGEMKQFVEKMRNENARIPELENEIERLREQLKKQKTIDDSDKSDAGSIVDLLDGESDEELKKNLTEAFKQSMFLKCSSSPKSRDKSTKKDISKMSETEKLTYYQRLHVQRLEVPKLMKYSGSSAEWMSFKSGYERLREKGEYDNETMIEKLRESLCGDAEKYVKQRLNQPFANADNIMDVLKKKFFQPKEAIANALMKLETWKQIPDKSRKDLEDFLLEIDDYIYLCKTLNFRPELEVSINSRITSKLPYDMELKWQQRIAEKKIKGNIVEMSAFLWAIVPNLPLRDIVHKDNVKKVNASVNLA